MLKGKVLRPDEAGEPCPLLEQHPALTTGAKIFVLGTTEQDLAKVQSIDQHVDARRSYRPPPAAKVREETSVLVVSGCDRFTDD